MSSTPSKQPPPFPQVPLCHTKNKELARENILEYNSMQKMKVHIHAFGFEGIETFTQSICTI